MPLLPEGMLTLGRQWTDTTEQNGKTQNESGVAKSE